MRRSVKIAAAMVVTAMLGVSAASAVVGGLPSAAAPRSPLAEPGSDRIDQTAPDPERGLDWGVRSYVSTSGGACVEAGVMSAGRFGQVDPRDGFRETPLQEGGTCGDLLAEPALLAINHYPAGADRAPRTVLFGQAGANVAEVRVTVPDGSARRVATGPRGAFVVPLAGALAPTDLPVQVTLLDGQRLTYDWR